MGGYSNDILTLTCVRCGIEFTRVRFQHDSNVRRGRRGPFCSKKCGHPYRPPKPMTMARFWQRVDRSGDCWLWMGAKNSHGYGHFARRPGTGTRRRRWTPATGGRPRNRIEWQRNGMRRRSVGKPEVRVEERQDGARVRVTVGTADVWIRATPGGQRLDIAIDEGTGEVDVEWSIRRSDATREPVIAGSFVQSPSRSRR